MCQCLPAGDGMVADGGGGHGNLGLPAGDGVVAAQGLSAAQGCHLCLKKIKIM